MGSKKLVWTMDRNLSLDKVDVAKALEANGIEIVYNAELTGVTLILPDGKEVDIVMPDGKKV